MKDTYTKAHTFNVGEYFKNPNSLLLWIFKSKYHLIQALWKWKRGQSFVGLEKHLWREKTASSWFKMAGVGWEEHNLPENP